MVQKGEYLANGGFAGFPNAERATTPALPTNSNFWDEPHASELVLKFLYVSYVLSIIIILMKFF